MNKKIIHYKKLSKPKRSLVYDSYWQFASKRFDVFEKRLIDRNGPWTEDDVIAKHRFTNVFRASDRVSQYLIQLQYKEDDIKEIFFKTLLFKFFNKIETYNYLSKELDEINSKTFNFFKYDSLLGQRMDHGNTIYSAAYIIPSASSAFGYKSKHSNHLALLDKMMQDKLYDKIANSKSLENVYHLLLGYPSLGNFLAFQFAIDLNYSSMLNFSEADFVVAGPGAKNGILKCFDSLGDYTFEDVIKMMADEQEQECKRLEIKQPLLWGRKLHLIDCQNLFCETDKYLRVTNPEINQAGRTRIKQKYTKINEPINYFFPPKWNINDKIDLKWQTKVNEGIYL